MIIQVRFNGLMKLEKGNTFYKTINSSFFLIKPALKSMLYGVLYGAPFATVLIPIFRYRLNFSVAT